MSLLFDQNLSRQLPRLLADAFPGSKQAALMGLSRATDDAIWQCALDHNLVIVTRDADFRRLLSERGTPPQVILLGVGNCTTARIEAIIRQHSGLIRELILDRNQRLLEIK